MSNRIPHIAVLGAGPAGVGAAYWLTRCGRAQVTILEQRELPGGNAGSFEVEGIRVDYGSHRLHPSCDPEILAELRELLGDDLLDRPRHGRIHLLGRWIHFPLKPLDLALNLPPSFAFRAALDSFFRSSTRTSSKEENFASVLEEGLGHTFCQEFYFPFARKLWGLEPHELSATQARRRVSANSPAKLLGRLLGAVPGLKRPGKGRFFYPRRGYGQISESLLEAARTNGAKVLLGSRVQSIEVQGQSLTVVFERNGKAERIEADHVWSTLPVTFLVKALREQVPAAVSQAASAMSFRGMILIYVALSQDRFSEYDAHYFPAEEIPISRMSEPKNYHCVREPADRTVLCAELPCDPGSAYWQMTDQELGAVVVESLAKAGLAITGEILSVTSRRLGQAYPVYSIGYEDHLATVEDWLDQFEGLLTFGRQGLFAHDNTHHALYMASAAVQCLSDDGEFNRGRWEEFRRVFETHVVED